MSVVAGPQEGFTCIVDSLGDALACSQRTVAFARSAGFSEREACEIGIAASELATNLVAHAGGGCIDIRFEPGSGLTIASTDTGPGIADIVSALSDDFSRGRRLSTDVPPGLRESLGSGLGAVKRLTDELHIEPRPGGGTLVRALKRLDASSASTQGDTERRTTVVLGLGNSILSDDGVGVKVVRHIAERGTLPGCDIKEAEVAGFALLDLLEGYERAVIVDAVRMRGARPGDVTVFDADSLDPSLHLVAGHQIDLPSALELGRRLKRPVPHSVYVVGVQIVDDTTFSEECTPEVRAAIPVAANIALRVAALGR